MLFPVYLGNNKKRYFLGTKGINTLIVLGLNPSKASNIESDPTITRTHYFCKLNKYDSFLMLNLYPLRSTSPADLPEVSDLKLHKLNKEIILDKISKNNYTDFLFCWGDNITLRSYLTEYLIDIYRAIKPFILHSYCLGNLTQIGNPRHPGRLAYETKFNKFDINSYIKKLTLQQ